MNSFLPAKLRAALYGVTAALGVLDTAAIAGFKAIHEANPVWLSFADGALPTLTAATGAVALSHIVTSRGKSSDDAPAPAPATANSTPDVDDAPDADSADATLADDSDSGVDLDPLSGQPITAPDSDPEGNAAPADSTTNPPPPAEEPEHVAAVHNNVVPATTPADDSGSGFARS